MIDTPLGRMTHEYLWEGGMYYRRPLFGPARWQVHERHAFGARWCDVNGPPAAAA